MAKSREDEARERLLLRRDPEEEGTYIVISEMSTRLGYVRGKYKDVVEWAVKQPKFYTDGWGGYITVLDILDV